MGRLLVTLTLLLTLIPAGWAQSYDDRLAITDRSDPEALFALVIWCRENGFHSSANQHIREILALDPNHAPTRELQGFVWNGRQWVHQSRLPPDQRQRPAAAAEPPLRRRQASRPGPTADAIVWDLSIPEVPAAETRFRPFLDGVARNMQGQDILEMEGNWRTMIRPEHRNQALAVIASGIMDGTYRDLWGPSMIATTLWQEGSAESQAQARRLLPFLVRSSISNRNPDAQLAFTAVAAMIGDVRAVPRLIEILEGPQTDAHGGARQALGQFTLFREQDITVAVAKEWWARFHDAPRSTVINESLNDPDPWVRLAAVRSISTTSWDARAMPTLFRLARESDSQVVDAAGRELQRLTGNNWGLNRGTAAADRERIVAQLGEWWDEQRANFVPVALRGQGTASSRAASPMEQWVRQLGDLDRTTVTAATTQLRRRGNEAIPALIGGLQASDGIVRNRARDLLREMTGQNFAFEGIAGTDAQRAVARERWLTWAREQGHLSE